MKVIYLQQSRIYYCSQKINLKKNEYHTQFFSY